MKGQHLLHESTELDNSSSSRAETRWNDACCSHKALFEVATEHVTLVALGLPVLNGHAPQRLVHHGGGEGRRPLLILRGRCPQPVMDVVGKIAGDFVCLSDQSTRNALVELHHRTLVFITGYTYNNNKGILIHHTRNHLLMVFMFPKGVLR